ncbi:PDZ domain-containing protein, partial [Candidatus Saccharibacteria bacterium]|nr:PDZ domain-containing protein [Candidatus Saccharibacteria bacterium]
MNKTAKKETLENKPNKITEVTLGTTVCGCIVTLVIGFFIGTNWDSIFANFKPYLGFKKTAGESLDLRSVQDLYTTLADNYDGAIDKSAIIEGAKKGMVAAVGDKYTTYMTADEASDYKKDLEGEIEEGGVGVSMAKREDYIRIIRTLPDNPARKAGVLDGDIVYAIDDVEVWMEDAESISKRLRGAEGTKVKLTVVRDNNKLDFELTREKINNVSADLNYE